MGHINASKALSSVSEISHHWVSKATICPPLTTTNLIIYEVKLILPCFHHLRFLLVTYWIEFRRASIIAKSFPTGSFLSLKKRTYPNKVSPSVFNMCCTFVIYPTEKSHFMAFFFQILHILPSHI